MLLSVEGVEDSVVFVFEEVSVSKLSFCVGDSTVESGLEFLSETVPPEVPPVGVCVTEDSPMSPTAISLSPISVGCEEPCVKEDLSFSSEEEAVSFWLHAAREENMRPKHTKHNRNFRIIFIHCLYLLFEIIYSTFLVVTL